MIFMHNNVSFRRYLLWGVALIALAHLSSADEWSWPEPASFHSRGFSYVAEIFPLKSRHNATEKPFCYFYAMEEEWGPTFLKMAAYFPYPAKL